MKKNISHILYGREKKITASEVVRQPLPHRDFRFANPFIVLHHLGPINIHPGTAGRIHPHPHRGFAPITFMLQGEGYHRDNAGHSATVGAGDVQWMYAGRGLLHSEGATTSYLEKGGPYELLQLWLNVPKEDKCKAPVYGMANKADLPVVEDLGSVHLRLVSGFYQGMTGPMPTFTPVLMMIGDVKRGESVSLKAKPGDWTLLYISQGEITTNGSAPVAMHNLVVFEKEKDEIQITATQDAQILYLSAEPIEEPLAVRDNFVMNTPEEITQAISDYKNGQFGTLEF